jgi:hypothetical protein
MMLQEAQPGEPPGKLVVLLLDLAGEDEEPLVYARRDGETELTCAGTWAEVGMHLRLEAAGTPDVSCEVTRTIELPPVELGEVLDMGIDGDATLLVDLEDWYLDPKLLEEDYAPDLWTEAPWLSTEEYKVRHERLRAQNKVGPDDFTWWWIGMIETELDRRTLKDERDELKKLRAEAKKLPAENARVRETQP